MRSCNRRRQQEDGGGSRAACLWGARRPPQDEERQPERSGHTHSQSITELANSLEGEAHPPGAHVLSSEVEAKLRSIFARCDAKGCGVMDKHELMKICSTEDDVATFLCLSRSHALEAVADEDHEEASWLDFCKFYTERLLPPGGLPAGTSSGPTATSSWVPASSWHSGAPRTEDAGGEVADASVQLRVGFAGIERTVVFDGRPLSEQVRKLAEELKLPEDEDFVLTEGLGRTSASICTRAQLLSMPAQVPLSLRSARDVARERLTDLRSALTSGRDRGGVASHLWGLLAVVHAEPGLAEAVIEEQGIHYVFLAALSKSGCTELAMACLCQLLRYQEGLNWLESHDEEVSCDLFQRFYEVLFPCGDSEDRKLVTAIPGVPPRSSLCVALFLLHMFPERAAAAAHSAAEGEDDPFIYERMIAALDGDDHFCTVASISVISAMGSATSGRESLRVQIEESIQACADSAGALDHFRQGGRQGAPIEQLFSMSMGACAQVVVSHNCERLAAGSRQARMSDQVRVSDVFGGHTENAVERIRQLKSAEKKLRVELRKRHATMCKMVHFMSVENCAKVEEALPAIIRSGWDSIQWPSNYTLLHYVADCVDDPGVVELVGLLATDVDSKDDKGMTALDYAIRKGRTGVATVLERLSELQELNATHDQAQIDGRKSMPVRRTSELQEQLSRLEDAPVELRTEIETVLQSGWASVTWPSNFTALHRAAKCGHVGAIEVLIYAGADPTTRDDWDLAPLDYAVQCGHEEAQVILQHVVGTPVARTGNRVAFSDSTQDAGEPEPQPTTAEAQDDGSPRDDDVKSTSLTSGKGRRPRPTYSSSFDLLKDQGRESDPDLFGLAQLRFELKRMKKENAKFQAARQERLSMGADSDPLVSGQTLGGGSLDEANLQKYFSQLQAFGREAVHSKLMEPELMGGLNLDETQAACAINQLRLVQRLVLGTHSGKPVGPAASATAEGDQDADGGASGPSKGKGKGKGAPPAPKGKGKGAPPAGPAKGKGKGAPPPGPAKGKGKGKAAGTEDIQKEDAPTQNKPVVTPTSQMKPLWWKMYVMGKQLKQGETVWDKVSDDMSVVPVDVLVSLFSKNASETGEKAASKQTVRKSTDEGLKVLRVVTDPQVVVCREAALKRLPSAEEVVGALEELNEEVLCPDRLQIVQDNACPTDAQLKQLQKLREQNPNVPMALPEQYMWVIGQLPAYKQRMDCWAFVRSYGESHQLYEEALETLEPILDCFTKSEALPPLLGFILAVGNYLNGGTNRGQADGFDLETLGKLESVKAPNGKDLRHFIFDVFFNQLSESAHLLIRDLEPCLLNVSRRVCKDSDGVEALSKGVRLTLEDIDQAITAVQAECRAKDEMMQMVLQYITDPADNFKLQMPSVFAQVRNSVDSLVKQRDAMKEKYSKVLSWFKIAGMKTSDLCLLWDNLLIPGDLIMNKPERTRKDVLIPRFCSNRPVSFDDIAVLWGIQEPTSGGLPSRPAPRGSNARRRGKRGGQPLQSRGKAAQPRDRAVVLQLQFAQRLMALQKQKAAQSEEPSTLGADGQVDPQLAAMKFARRLSARHQKPAGGAVPEVPSGSVSARRTSQDRLAAAGFTKEDS